MRSRYCAFVVLHSAYLLQTWHPRTRPRRIELDEEQRWTGLEILDRSGGGLFDSTGMVEFKAHYIVDDRAGVVHERSQFARHDNAWVYVGPVAAPTRAGR
jgi:SEC-C motif-containing protein